MANSNVLRQEAPDFINGVLSSPTGIALPGVDALLMKPSETPGQPDKIISHTTTLFPTGGFQFANTENLSKGFYYIKFEDPHERFFIPSYTIPITDQALKPIEARAQNNISSTDTPREGEGIEKGISSRETAAKTNEIFTQQELNNEKTKQYLAKTLENKAMTDETRKFDINHLTSKYDLTREERIQLGKEIEQQNYRRVALERLARTKLSANQITQEQLDQEIATINSGLEIDLNRLDPTLRLKIQEANLSDNVNFLEKKFGLTIDEKEMLRNQIREAGSSQIQKEQELRKNLIDGKISQQEFVSEIKNLQGEFIIDPAKLDPALRSKIYGALKLESKDFQKKIDNRASEKITNEKINEMLINRIDENAKTRPSSYQRPAATTTIPREEPRQQMPFPSSYSQKTPQKRGVIDNVNNLYNNFRTARNMTKTGRGIATGARTTGTIARLGSLFGGGTSTATGAVAGAGTVAAAPEVAVGTIVAIIIIIIILLIMLMLIVLFRRDQYDTGTQLPYIKAPGLYLKLEAPDRAKLGDIINYTLQVQYNYAQTTIPINKIALHAQVPNGTEYIDSPNGIYNKVAKDMVWGLANPLNQNLITFRVKATTDNIFVNTRVFATVDPLALQQSTLLTGQSQTLKEIFTQAAATNNIPLSFLIAEAKSESAVLGFTDAEVQQFSTPSWWVGLPDDAPTVDQLNPLVKRGYAYNTCAFPKSDPICPGKDVRGATQFEIATWNNTWAGETVQAGYTPDRRNVRDVVYGSAILFRKAAILWNDEFGFLDSTTDWDERQVRAMAAIYCGGSPYYDTSVRGCGRPGMPYSTIVWLNYQDCKINGCL